jgi:hypothetical protein
MMAGVRGRNMLYRENSACKKCCVHSHKRIEIFYYTHNGMMSPKFETLLLDLTVRNTKHREGKFIFWLTLILIRLCR